MPQPLSKLELLQHCLEQEARLLSEFINILQHEASILIADASLESLNSITKEKSNYAEKLEHQSSLRNQQLQIMGYKENRAGLDTARLAHPQLSDAVYLVLEKTAQASMLNNSNGRIIARFLNQNQDALDALHHLTGGNTLYGADGRKQSKTGISRIKVR